ncbi:MAG: hypothetical protein IPK04_14720 [Bdellovibrionales bacterium]|nr:hypothetical protein [Bdellovibrionales bacterium]
MLSQYCNSRGVTPDIFVVINGIVQGGNGIHSQNFNNQAVIRAFKKGFVDVVEGRVFITKKGEVFIKTLLVLAEEAGEL